MTIEIKLLLIGIIALLVNRKFNFITNYYPKSASSDFMFYLSGFISMFCFLSFAGLWVLKRFFLLLLLPIAAHAQLPCMDCDMVVPTSYNAVAASYSPGEDISSPTVAVCPWGIQLAAYSTFQMGPENTFCVYQEGKYLYFLAWELFPTVEQAKRRIAKLGLKGKAIPKPVKGFSIFIKPVQ